jgi:L-ascorbate metabolism protein UlaG (beta-lactamase superfamily)
LGLDDSDEIEIGSFRLFGVPAAHEQVERDAEGRCRYLGYIVACMQPGGYEVGWTLYHSGDTMLYAGMVETLVNFDVDIALLPINGSAPERRVAGNLDGKEAAGLAQAIAARLVIPCHYDMFAFNTVTPDLFVETCERLGQPYKVLQNGERLSLVGA